jgi:hypothetical protein
MNQIEFKYETFLEGKHKLVTRGEIEVPREALKPYSSISFPYCYLSTNGIVYSIGRTGLFDHPNRGSEYDLLMIPIESIKEPTKTDETIPFDLEKFKSGLYKVIDKKGVEPLNAIWNEHRKEMVLIYKDNYPECFISETYYEHLRLIPIEPTPYTHPQMYEVSDDEFSWWEVEKYYDDNLAQSWKHLAKCTVHEAPGRYRHLRLKQPTEISKDQAFDVVANLESVKEKLTEKFGTFKIKSL